MLAIGLMSGTSMDGIDAALIKTDGINLIDHIDGISINYDHDFKILLKAAEFSINKNQGNIQKSIQNFANNLEFFLTEKINYNQMQVTNFFAKNPNLSLEQIFEKSTNLHIDIVKDLIARNNLSKNEIEVIGYHGQTFYHHPEQKISIAIGDGKKMANITGITVINNFRMADILNGGQGAPFAPLFHKALAEKKSLIPTAIINCGGIANISIIKSTKIEEIIGFDSGPGNGLIDNFVRFKTNGKENMDQDGKYAQNGKIDSNLIELLYEKSVAKKNFYSDSSPKSLDINDLIIIDEVKNLSLEDGCRVLAAFTADSIAKSLQNIKIDNCILAGGGWNNPVILKDFKMAVLKYGHLNLKIYLAEEIGWNNKFLEAQIFGYLAVRTIKSLPISYPNITGVMKPTIGGKINRPHFS